MTRTASPPLSYRVLVLDPIPFADTEKTHGHGDHWFGTAMLLKRFPEAKAHATAGTIEVMRFHGNPEFRAATWDMGFPGQIPASPVVSTPAPGQRLRARG